MRHHKPACMERYPAWVLILFVMCLGSAARAAGVPFQIDNNTLLLSHFNHAYIPDYANGWSEFSGSGAHLVPGYINEHAIDLTGIQYVPDFMHKADSLLPGFTGFGFWGRSNLNLNQGTMEFWFRVPSTATPYGYYKDNFLALGPAQLPDKGDVGRFHLNQNHLAYQVFGEFPGTDGSRSMTDTVDFHPTFKPDQWHHFAMCWSPGEFAIYIDGRLASAQNMAGRNVPIILASPLLPIWMGGIVMDEFRISNIVRYHANFEPNWAGGARPAYAFAGRDLTRYPAKTFTPLLPSVVPAYGTATVSGKIGDFTLTFDSASGFLKGINANGISAIQNCNGLLIWNGSDTQQFSDRKLEQPAMTKASDWKIEPASVSFKQTFSDGLIVTHRITNGPAGLKWQATFQNVAGDAKYLETLMSVPAAIDGAPHHYFDMSFDQTKLKFPRRIDEYCYSLPFVAVSGSAQSLGLGLDPHGHYSALISEWIPSEEDGKPTVRQGTRFVLNKSETPYTLTWHLFTADADFGINNALSTYYDRVAPDLYHLNPAVPIASYMSLSTHQFAWGYPIGDMMRTCYQGEQWGESPTLCGGDEYGQINLFNKDGVTDFWALVSKSTSTRWDYQTSLKQIKRYKTMENLHKTYPLLSQYVYLNSYALWHNHYQPSWAYRFEAETLYPQGMMGGDPLVASQYYAGRYAQNEYNTPNGNIYLNSTKYIMQACASWCPGFINDMCQTSPIRWQDADDGIVDSVPGRAFASDRGQYVVAALGHARRYTMINNFHDPRGFQSSMCSDGGIVSYDLSALSATDAVETGMTPAIAPNVELGARAGRHLLGQKPITSFWEDTSVSFGDFTGKHVFHSPELRDYFRYMDAHIMLTYLKDGQYTTREMMKGKQWMIENFPMLVESVLSGRQAVNGATASNPALFIRRGGSGLSSILVAGNETSQTCDTDITAYGKYFNGRPILLNYFGGSLSERLNADSCIITKVTVAPRSILGLKLLGTLSGTAPAELTARFSGDGLSMKVEMDITSQSPTNLYLNTFAPIYRIQSVLIGSTPSAQDKVTIPAGTTKVTVSYVNSMLNFDAATWEKVDLIPNAETTNFDLVTDQGSEVTAAEEAVTTDFHRVGLAQQSIQWHFDNGTAWLLNQFIQQYDEEDGIVGNLKVADLYSSPQHDGKWQIIIDSKHGPTGVSINASAKMVVIHGVSTGEARRAMIVFLRLMDRKYPHVGRMFDLWQGTGMALVKKVSNMNTREAIANLPDDPQHVFLNRPLLEADGSYYDGDNLNFQGKYKMHWSPFIYEPMVSDNYVLGSTWLGY